jgi:hypothetical protein
LTPEGWLRFGSIGAGSLKSRAVRDENRSFRHISRSIRPPAIVFVLSVAVISTNFRAGRRKKVMPVVRAGGNGA